MKRSGKKVTLMAKPIEATPVLKGKDLINLAEALKKTDSKESLAKRQSAYALLKRVQK